MTEARRSDPPAGFAFGDVHSGLHKVLDAGPSARAEYSMMKQPLALLALLAILSSGPFARLLSAAPVTTDAMGAVPVQGGVSFRVWAPNATAVHVRGSFNSWGLTNPLSSEGDSGLWCTVVPAATAGDPYKFFVTNANSAIAGTTTVWRRDPYTRVVDQFAANDSNSVVYDGGAFDWGDAPTFVAPSRESMVLYEMHIGSFMAPDGAPGTFADATTGLDRLQALGINAVELLPLHENPGANNWGYDPTLLLAIENEYGGPDGFKAFVRACHERGIAVIVDVVVNHTTMNQNDLWNFDLWSEGDGGGIWFYNEATNRDTPWGPRYDYRRPEVQRLILDSLRMYLEEFRVDGFRFDATGVMRIGNGGAVPGAAEMLQQCTEILRAEYPGKLFIAEDFQLDELASKPVAAGGLGFDAEWNSFYANVARLLVTNDAGRSLAEATSGLTKTFNGDPFARVIYSESHDSAAPENPTGETFPYRGGYLPRRLNQVDPATNLTTRKLTMLGSVLTLTAPGIPMLFMGQETYATGTFSWPNPPAMDWDGLLAAHGGIEQLHRDLIGLRLNRGTSTRGLVGPNVAVYHVNNSAKVMAYRRFDAGGPGDDTLVVMNLSGTDFGLGYMIGAPRQGEWIVRFNSDLKSYDNAFSTTPGTLLSVATSATTTDGLPYRLNIPRLAPYSAMILSQQTPATGFVIE
ncbi:1,4-alpha-glucan branching protein [bacterium]|nr:1,4-alpha-glucan branching protein [bacterium]